MNQKPIKFLIHQITTVESHFRYKIIYQWYMKVKEDSTITLKT